MRRPFLSAATERVKYLIDSCLFGYGKPLGVCSSYEGSKLKMVLIVSSLLLQLSGCQIKEPHASLVGNIEHFSLSLPELGLETVTLLSSNTLLRLFNLFWGPCIVHFVLHQKEDAG
jgi:hypothetical protein